MRFRVAVMAAVSLVLALLAGVVAQSSFADTSVALGLSGFRDLAIDPPHGDDPGHVIVSGWNPAYGGTHTGVVETGLDGSNPAGIGTLTHAEGLAMAPDDSLVYAALDDGDDIASFAPTDPQNTITTFSTGASTCPHDVAVAGDGKVWFSYGCTTNSIDLGVLDPSDSSVTLGLATGLFGRVLSGGALLANAQAAPNSIVVGERAGPGIVAVLSVSGKTPTLVKSGSIDFAVDIEVAPDAASFLLVQSNSNDTVHRLSMTDLSNEGSYTRVGGPLGNIYTSTAAESDDASYVAAGGYADNSVTTFGPDSSTPIRTFLFGSDATVEGGHALAWIGHTLVVVTTDAFTRAPTLHFLSGAIQAPSKITLSGPSRAARATALTVTGQLVSRGTGVQAPALTVIKHDMDGNHALPNVSTDSAGHFSVHDTPAVGGAVTYTVAFAGDDTHGPASKTIKISVSRASAALSISTNHPSYGYNDRATVTAHLGRAFSNHKISIYAQPFGGTARLVRTATADAHGDVTATVAVTVKTTFKATYSGDERFAPDSASARATVHAKVQTAVGGVQRKDGKYRVYSARNGGGVAVKVSPNKAGENVKFVLQVSRNGAWHTVDTAFETLNSSSVIGVGFKGTKGYHYRVRGQFGGDAANLAEDGAWQYAEFA